LSAAALVVTGPTTSGKTAVSLALATRLHAEIISMDSRQVYRGLDIGTDKVSLVDRARAPHHGLDQVNPDERYGAGRFARDARRWIRAIRARGRTPLLAGGTGFYHRALARPLFREPPLEPARRRELAAVLERWSTEDLAHAVGTLDPDRAQLAIQGGRQRLVRTLEIPLLTGRALSWWHRHAQVDSGEALRLVTVVLEVPRETLDQAINARVERMMGRGLEAEVERLLEAGYNPRSAPGMSGTGYREVAALLEGRLTRVEAVEAMTAQTRQYARRQLTWFRTQLPDAPRIDATRTLDEQVNEIERIWRGRAA